jgi:hypothetical protein
MSSASAGSRALTRSERSRDFERFEATSTGDGAIVEDRSVVDAVRNRSAYRQVKRRVDLAVSDLGDQRLENIDEPIRAYSIQVGVVAPVKPEPTIKNRNRHYQVSRLVVGGSLGAFQGSYPVERGGYRFA